MGESTTRSLVGEYDLIAADKILPSLGPFKGNGCGGEGSGQDDGRRGGS